MKTILLLLSAATFIQHAHAQTAISAKCLSISNATVQNWSPGAVQSDGKPAGGVIYQIDAIVKKSGALMFDSLFVGGKSLALEVTKGTERSYHGSFRKKDMITLFARQDKSRSYKKTSVAVSEFISSRNEVAFISIWMNGKRYLHPVSEFKKKSEHRSNQ